MQSHIKFFLAVVAASTLLMACDKADDLTIFDKGNAPTLTASATTLTPPPADSNKVVLTVNWTDPKYATDTARYKYVLDIDSATKNFSAPLTKTFTGTRSAQFTAKELNTFLVNRGYAFGVPVDLDVRVTSSYANNNERLQSNVVRIKFTPYKIPPKVALPTGGRLFIVGDATTFGWSNDAAPAFPAAREFSRLDETTWAGIFYMNGSGAYKILQTQGVWGTQFHMVAGGTATSGSFVQEDADPAFPSPAAAGWYKITLDFQSGKYTVVPYAGTLPTNLFIVGDATAGGWNNPVPVPGQQLTRVNSSEWKITLPLTGGKEFLLLPNNGDWSNKYSVANKSVTDLWKGGEFGYNLPDNFPGPPTSGNYTITVNFAAGGSTNSNAGRFTIQ